mmetsp:Transcript_73596/g.204517  ORF Transcript_73596/g.204517 Transcript_73596/m.204517 type:complete len:455 (-) Transcript_73596:88-1452(-)
MSWQQWLRNPRARRVATLASKGAVGTAAAAAGLVLGLREAKRALHAEQATEVWREASLDLRGGTGDRASASSSAGPSLVSRFAEASGISAADFQAAARRLRPVEPDLEKFAAAWESFGAAEVRTAAAALTQRWRDNGYFEDLGLSGGFGRRLTSDAQGVDIGVRVPTYLQPEEAVPTAQTRDWGASGASRDAALAALQRWGCTLLRGALATDDVQALREAFGLGKGAGTRRAAEVGQWMLQRDPNIAMGRYTFGRLHCLLRGSPIFEQHAVAAHAAVAPLVHAFFGEQVSAGDRVFLSEAQLVIADPCAEAQKWHLDQAAGPGLTIFVPLTNVEADRGPQAVLPGTHHLHDKQLPMRSRLRRCLGALSASHGALSVTAGEERAATWSAGDALVLDGRLMHRGLENDGLGSPVPFLVLRYDLASTPPPGCGRSHLLLASALGAALESVFRLYAAV